VTNFDDSRDLLLVAAEAIQRAGQLITRHAPRDVTDKGDRDVRTDVDMAAEDYIRAYLGAQTPEIPVLGEEEGGPRPDRGILWVVDPIDGTVNFLHGIPNYAVSISLIEHGRTILGATHLPAFGTTYTVLAGYGSRADNVPIRASRTTALRESVIAVDQFTFSGLDPRPVNDMRLAVLKELAPLVQRLRIHGASAVDLAWTAQGRLDACIIFGNSPWDTSAGVLLAREAGAQVVDLHGDPHAVTSTTTVAAAPGVLDELIAAIKAVTP
jgi:myo-inositol-1(or 4)-monophosphatase